MVIGPSLPSAGHSTAAGRIAFPDQLTDLSQPKSDRRRNSLRRAGAMYEPITRTLSSMAALVSVSAAQRKRGKQAWDPARLQFQMTAGDVYLKEVAAEFWRIAGEPMEPVETTGQSRGGRRTRRRRRRLPIRLPDGAGMAESGHAGLRLVVARRRQADTGRLDFGRQDVRTCKGGPIEYPVSGHRRASPESFTTAVSRQHRASTAPAHVADGQRFGSDGYDLFGRHINVGFWTG
jgi:hypothetical protein